jgi:hypothetical protein
MAGIFGLLFLSAIAVGDAQQTLSIRLTILSIGALHPIKTIE